MGSTASPFLNPIAAELDDVGPRPTAQVLSRRTRQRRDDVPSSFGLPVRVHNGTLSPANDAVVPLPGLRIDGLTDTAQYAEGIQFEGLDMMIA